MRFKQFIENTISEELKIGSIFYTSFGYNTTIVDFYEIVKNVGKATVELKKLKKKAVKGDLGYSGQCVPIPGQYIDNKIYRSRVIGNSPNKIDGQYSFPWNGKPIYFNHID